MPGFTLGKAKPPSGATTGGTPERPQKSPMFFQKISVSKFLVHLEKTDARHKELRYGASRVVGRLRHRDTAPPSPPHAYVAYEREIPRRRLSKSHTKNTEIK